jgi:hypothetical protein
MMIKVKTLTGRPAAVMRKCITQYDNRQSCKQWATAAAAAAPARQGVLHGNQLLLHAAEQQGLRLVSLHLGVCKQC